MPRFEGGQVKENFILAPEADRSMPYQPSAISWSMVELPAPTTPSGFVPPVTSYDVLCNEKALASSLSTTEAGTRLTNA